MVTTPTQLHDTLWTLRHLFFLLLPLVVHSTPPSQPPDPTNSLIATHAKLQTTLTRLTSLKYMRGALMRDPHLRASATQWWDNQRISGGWVREEPSVQKLADKFGYGYGNGNGNGNEGDHGGTGANTVAREEGKLRTNARLAVNALRSGMLAPSEPVN